MQITMTLCGMVEEWDADSGESQHKLRLEYGGRTFLIPVTREEATAVVTAAVLEEGPGPDPTHNREPLTDSDDVPDVGETEQETLTMEGFHVQAAPLDEVSVPAPVPSALGLQAVPRTKVRNSDGEFCGQG